MNVFNLRNLVEALVTTRGHAWEVEGDNVLVRVGGGGRTQRIHVSRDGHHCAFTTVVLGKARVNKSDKRRRALAVHDWTRNAETELVNFTFDRHGRLIGEIRHPAYHLDLEELELYVKLLAAEGDRFEHVLTGEDRY